MGESCSHKIFYDSIQLSITFLIFLPVIEAFPFGSTAHLNSPAAATSSLASECLRIESSVLARLAEIENRLVLLTDNTNQRDHLLHLQIEAMLGSLDLVTRVFYMDKGDGSSTWGSAAAAAGIRKPVSDNSAPAQLYSVSGNVGDSSAKNSGQLPNPLPVPEAVSARLEHAVSTSSASSAISSLNPTPSELAGTISTLSEYFGSALPNPETIMSSLSEPSLPGLPSDALLDQPLPAVSSPSSSLIHTHSSLPTDPQLGHQSSSPTHYNPMDSPPVPSNTGVDASPGPQSVPVPHSLPELDPAIHTVRLSAGSAPRSLRLASETLSTNTGQTENGRSDVPSFIGSMQRLQSQPFPPQSLASNPTKDTFKNESKADLDLLQQFLNQLSPPESLANSPSQTNSQNVNLPDTSLLQHLESQFPIPASTAGQGTHQHTNQEDLALLQQLESQQSARKSWPSTSTSNQGVPQYAGQPDLASLQHLEHEMSALSALSSAPTSSSPSGISQSNLAATSEFIPSTAPENSIQSTSSTSSLNPESQPSAPLPHQQFSPALEATRTAHEHSTNPTLSQQVSQQSNVAAIGQVPTGPASIFSTSATESEVANLVPDSNSSPHQTPYNNEVPQVTSVEPQSTNMAPRVANSLPHVAKMEMHITDSAPEITGTNTSIREGQVTEDGPRISSAQVYTARKKLSNSHRQYHRRNRARSKSRLADFNLDSTPPPAKVFSFKQTFERRMRQLTGRWPTRHTSPTQPTTTLNQLASASATMSPPRPVYVVPGGSPNQGRVAVPRNLPNYLQTRHSQQVPSAPGRTPSAAHLFGVVQPPPTEQSHPASSHSPPSSISSPSSSELQHRLQHATAPLHSQPPINHGSNSQLRALRVQSAPAVASSPPNVYHNTRPWQPPPMPKQPATKSPPATNSNIFKPRDCSSSAIRRSGAYRLASGMAVYCDDDTDGGGWTVIQKRTSGAVSFRRGWEEYKAGFGDLHGEFWLGNEHIHQLTNRPGYGLWKLRVEIEDIRGNVAFGEYEEFTVGSESQNYALELENFMGTSHDALEANEGMSFSTFDRDNDSWRSGNCANVMGGGFWYSNCGLSNVNGPYLSGMHGALTFQSTARPSENGGKAAWMFWWPWHRDRRQLRTVQMKFRPINYAS